MCGECGLDLLWIDILAAADDHVLAAIDQREEAFRLHTREIAGVDPAVADRLACRLGVAPVADHTHRALADDDLPDAADGHPFAFVIDDPAFGEKRLPAGRLRPALVVLRA